MGDPALGEWEEWQPGGRVFHLRRRLTVAEAEITGPVADVRGTDEARRRAVPIAVAGRLHQAPPQVLAEELGVMF